MATGYVLERRERIEEMLRPLFEDCHVVDFRAGTVFRGPTSRYCELHRKEVEKGLRRLPGAYCFEKLDGRTYLTYTLPALGAHRVSVPLHLLLFVATVLTTLVAGASWRFDKFLVELGASITGAAGSQPLGDLFGNLVAQGGMFSLAIILILGTHECGHYLMARRYGMLVTPPFFLPAPIPPIGTFGAVIRMRSPMMHRRALMDIGVAGPLAGLVVAFPFLIYGLSHAKFMIVRYWEPGGGLYFGHSLLTWGLSRLLLGAPPPGYAVDWLSHPFAWAGWIGLLVTSLNLMPVGQLDGGHVAYALVGRRQRLVAWFFIGALLALSRQWPGWVFWTVLMVALVRVSHPPVVLEGVKLGRGRKVLGWAMIVVLLLLFLPAPVRGVF